jgi:hypothetical protein
VPKHWSSVNQLPPSTVPKGQTLLNLSEGWEDKIAELNNLITEKNINMKEIVSGKRTCSSENE